MLSTRSNRLPFDNVSFVRGCDVVVRGDRFHYTSVWNRSRPLFVSAEMSSVQLTPWLDFGPPHPPFISVALDWTVLSKLLQL